MKLSVRGFFELAFVAMLASTSMLQAREVNAGTDDFVVEHTFWVKPGRSIQFSNLYKRIELPKLDALVTAGKLKGYRISQPQFTSGNEQWDYRVTLYWRDAQTAIESSPLDIDRRKSDANGRLEDQLMLELMVDHDEVLLREAVKGAISS